jgi:hypothetical protein
MDTAAKLIAHPYLTLGCVLTPFFAVTAWQQTWKLCRHVRRRYKLSKYVKYSGTSGDGALDDVDNFTLRPKSRSGSRHAGGKLMARAIAHAKVHLGMDVQYTPANKMVARDLVSKYMREHNHRERYMLRDVPLAVEAVFTPSLSELYALEWRESHEVVERRELKGEPQRV